MILPTKTNLSVRSIGASPINETVVYQQDYDSPNSSQHSKNIGGTTKIKQTGRSKTALQILAIVMTGLSMLQFRIGHHPVLEYDNDAMQPGGSNSKERYAKLPPSKQREQSTFQKQLQVTPKQRTTAITKPSPINKIQPLQSASKPILTTPKERITKSFLQRNHNITSRLKARTRPPRKQASPILPTKTISRAIDLSGMPTEPSPDNFNVNWREDPDDKNAIKLLVSKEELVFMQQRSNRYHAWRNASMMDMKSKQKLQPKYNPGIDYFNYTADQEGPWLDFLIAGFPKCGTTTMMGTLSQLAPMPAEKDVCELPTKLMTLVYEEWPTQFGSAIEYGGTSPLLLRGTKCPSFVGNLGGAMMKIFSNSFKKTKFIIGIRHPVLWFQSFWRMQGRDDPYDRMGTCPCKSDKYGLRFCKNETNHSEVCWNECGRSILCLARARFHLTLAQLGKTNLTDEEREWLAPNDFDGGKEIVSLDIPNQIFLYDQTELKEDYLWTGLAKYLRVSRIPEQQYKGAKGKNLQHLSLCEPKYDAFRAAMMPYAYELSVWLQKYFLPITTDPSREDVVVANAERIADILESYKKDPCGRLVVQIDDVQGKYGNSSRPNITNWCHILEGSSRKGRRGYLT